MGFRSLSSSRINPSYIAAFFLAIAPVLDPYILFSFRGNDIRVNDLLLIICVGVAILFGVKPKRKYSFLMLWCLTVSFFNFGSLFSNSEANYLLEAKVLLKWFGYSVC